MPDWPELSTRFKLHIAFEDVRPTEADLDAFEARFGLALPDDYRRFVLALGAGEIDDVDFCEIYAPGGPPGYHPKADIVGLNVGLREALNSPLSRPHVDREPAWLDALVFFCVTGEGDYFFAWQPGEVTDPAGRDLAIYLVHLGGRNGKVVRVASTFREFVMDFLVANRYFRDYLPGSPVDEYPDPGRVVGYAQRTYFIPED